MTLRRLPQIELIPTYLDSLHDIAASVHADLSHQMRVPGGSWYTDELGFRSNPNDSWANTLVWAVGCHPRICARLKRMFSLWRASGQCHFGSRRH